SPAVIGAPALLVTSRPPPSNPRRRAHVGIETVPQVVANEADAHDHKREDDAGHRGDPPSGIEVIPAGGDRRPPAWRRSRRAEAEKAQRGLGYDHQPELERG